MATAPTSPPRWSTRSRASSTPRGSRCSALASRLPSSFLLGASSSSFLLGVKKALDGARDQALANIKGTVMSEKSSRLDGFEGREVVFQATGAEGTQTVRGVVRLFASARPPSAYMASAMRMTERADPDAHKFLDSLHLGKKVEAAP